MGKSYSNIISCHSFEDAVLADAKCSRLVSDQLDCDRFMHYLAAFGYVQESWEMILGFLVVSLASSFVESLPISTELDDNLTVTLTSILLGNLVF